MALWCLHHAFVCVRAHCVVAILPVRRRPAQVLASYNGWKLQKVPRKLVERLTTIPPYRDYYREGNTNEFPYASYGFENDIKDLLPALSVVVYDCTECAHCHLRTAGAARQEEDVEDETNREDAPVVRLKACSGCEKVWYCSRPCQVAHWRYHKEQCGYLRRGGVVNEGDKVGVVITRNVAQELGLPMPAAGSSSRVCAL